MERLTERPVLERLLAAYFEDFGVPADAAETPVEDLVSFAGGLALQEGGRVLVEPGCCCSLGGIRDWEGAVRAAGPLWETFWIGHPWASVRREGELLWIRLEEEYGAPREPSLLGVPVEALRGAVREAEEELEAFSARLEPVVAAPRGWAGRCGSR